MNPPDDTLLAAVDAHMQQVGENNMEILLFSLGTTETFGINVFKVREVSKTPQITKAPNIPAAVEGLISLRGTVIPVVSLARSLELPDAPTGLGGTMMVTESGKRTLGFLVQRVDRIVRADWDRVHAPEAVIRNGNNSFITAIVALSNGKLVSILDVEQILVHVFGDTPVGELTHLDEEREYNVFFVDDSAVARKKIAEILDKLGAKHKYAQNGIEAWTRLTGIAADAQRTGCNVRDKLQLILVDAEMPEMNGYMLTKHIKSDPRFDGVPVVMHSSLSSAINRAMSEQCGVDAYVSKFDGQALADVLRPLLASPIRH